MALYLIKTRVYKPFYAESESYGEAEKAFKKKIPARYYPQH